jgi:hypothetical protein
MSINIKNDSYHWDCFITTKQGKKFEVQLIKNKEKAKKQLQENQRRYPQCVFF